MFKKSIIFSNIIFVSSKFNNHVAYFLSLWRQAAVDAIDPVRDCPCRATLVLRADRHGPTIFSIFDFFRDADFRLRPVSSDASRYIRTDTMLIDSSQHPRDAEMSRFWNKSGCESLKNEQNRRDRDCLNHEDKK